MEQPNGKVPNGHAATPQSPTNGGVAAGGPPQHFSYLGCGFARCAPGCRPGAAERGDAWKRAWECAQHLHSSGSAACDRICSWQGSSGAGISLETMSWPQVSATAFPNPTCLPADMLPSLQ